MYITDSKGFSHREGQSQQNKSKGKAYYEQQKRKDIQNIATKQQPLYSLLYTHCTDYTFSVGPVHFTTHVESPLEMTIHASVKVEYIESWNPKEHGTITE